MIPITLLLFLSLEFAKGKSYHKPTSVLLLLIFGILHTKSSSAPAGMGPVRGKFWTSTQRVIQPFQSQTKQLQPSVPAALAPRNQPPTPNNQQQKAKAVPDENLALKKCSLNYKALHCHPLKTETGVANFLNSFPCTKVKIFYSLQLLWKPNIGKLSYTSGAI